MARTTIGNYNSNSSSYTKMLVEYESISATLIRIYLKYTLGSGTSLGTINGRRADVSIYNSGGALLASGSLQVKNDGAESWVANGVYDRQFDITIPYQSGGTLLVTALTVNTTGTITSCRWNATANVNYASQVSVGWPVWNTAPYWGAAVFTAPTTNPFLTTTASHTVSWQAASDAQGDPLTYYLHRSVNGGAFSVRTSGVGLLAYTDDLSDIAPGGRVAYAVSISDPYGLGASDTWYINSGNFYRNTLAYWSGGVVSPSPSGIIPEDTAAITVSWTPAIEPNGYGVSYDVYRNGVRLLNTSATSYVDNIGAGNPGATYQYSVYVHDGLEWTPTPITSAVVTKNVFTSALLNHSGNIAFASPSVGMSRTAPANSNGNTSFGYSLSCTGLPVYNPTADLATNGNVLKIWRTGDAVPAGPYIKFSELKALLASTSYAGTIRFTLLSWNGYGSSGSDIEDVYVDLRMVPTGLTAPVYSGGYTCPGAVLRYLPDQRAVTLIWGAATDPLGTAIVYDVFYKLTSVGTWTLIHSNLSVLTATISPPSADTQQLYDVKVVAKTTYNYTQEASGAVLPIDKYLRPNLKVMSKNRLSTSIAVSLEIERRASFTVDLTALSYTKLGGAVVALPTNDLTPDFTYTEAGVFLDTSSYTMNLSVQDAMGTVLGAVAVTNVVVVTSYIPMFSIRKKGIGINTINDGTGSYKGIIRGKMNSVADDMGNKGFYVDGKLSSISVPTYHFPLGILIDLDASTTDDKMYSIELKGNSYAAVFPINTLLQVYHYIPSGVQQIVQPYQMNYGHPVGAAKFFLDAGRLKCWVPPCPNYSMIMVTCACQTIGHFIPTSITNAVEPTGTNKVSCVVTQSWHNGNDGAGSLLDADIIDGLHAWQFTWFKSIRNFTLGTMIKTKINYANQEGAAWFLEIKGNTYAPEPQTCQIQVQGYIYANTCIATGGTRVGGGPPVITAFNYLGELCFYFAPRGYWQGYMAYCTDASGNANGPCLNEVYAIWDSGIPSGYSKAIDITLTDH